MIMFLIISMIFCDVSRHVVVDAYNYVDYYFYDILWRCR